MPLKFDLGTVVWTRGVNELVAENEKFSKFVLVSLKRHAAGDWGDVDAEDKQTNEYAMAHEERLVSAYNDDRFPRNGVATIWIITEWDRSLTTILFPDEY